MAQLIQMWPLGDFEEEARISKWMASPGDSLFKDQAMAEIETDKVTMELTAFEECILLAIVAKEGDVIRSNEPIAILGEWGDDISAWIREYNIDAIQIAEFKETEVEIPEIVPARTSKFDGRANRFDDHEGRVSGLLRKLGDFLQF